LSAAELMEPPTSLRVPATPFRFRRLLVRATLGFGWRMRPFRTLALLLLDVDAERLTTAERPPRELLLAPVRALALARRAPLDLGLVRPVDACAIWQPSLKVGRWFRSSPGTLPTVGRIPQFARTRRLQLRLAREDGDEDEGGRRSNHPAKEAVESLSVLVARFGGVSHSVVLEGGFEDSAELGLARRVGRVAERRVLKRGGHDLGQGHGIHSKLG
jgi:hypothetical protein